MNRTSTIVIIVIAILIVVSGILLATYKSSPATSPSTSPASSSNTGSSPSPAGNSSPAASSPATATATTLHYNASGFSPSSITVTAGQKLSVKNDSSATIQVDSDPHPQHTDNTELNIGTISPGTTASVTLTRTGSWGIHNHLDPTMRATVVVK